MKRLGDRRAVGGRSCSVFDAVLALGGILCTDRVARCSGNGEDRVHHFMRGVFRDEVSDRSGGSFVHAIEGPDGAELPAGFLRPGEFVSELILVPVGRHLAIGFDAGPHLEIL